MQRQEERERDSDGSEEWRDKLEVERNKHL